MSLRWALPADGIAAIRGPSADNPHAPDDDVYRMATPFDRA